MTWTRRCTHAGQALVHTHRRKHGPTDKQSLLAHTHTHTLTDMNVSTQLLHTHTAPRRRTHSTSKACRARRHTHARDARHPESDAFAPCVRRARPELDSRAHAPESDTFRPRSLKHAPETHPACPESDCLTHTHTHTHTLTVPLGAIRSNSCAGCSRPGHSSLPGAI